MTFYEILQVDPHASVEEIQTAYIAFAKMYHPDLNSPEVRQISEEYMKKLNQARDILCDVHSRSEYDEYLIASKKSYHPAYSAIKSRRLHLLWLIPVIIGLLIIGTKVYKSYAKQSEENPKALQKTVAMIEQEKSEFAALDKEKTLLMKEGSELYQLVLKLNMLEKDIIKWRDSGDIEKYNINYPKYESMRKNYNSKVNTYESKRLEFNAKIEALHKKYGFEAPVNTP